MTNILVTAQPTISLSVSSVSPGGIVECQVVETPLIIDIASIGVQGPQGSGAYRMKSELLAGDIDGENTEFSTSHEFVEGSVTISINGLVQTPDSFTEYPSESKVVFADAPKNIIFTDSVFIQYFY